VPEDIAIGGFDDIPMARYVDPPLTSVHVDISALGERAVTALLSVLRHPGRHEFTRETAPTTLVVRRSCGARLHEGGPPSASYPASPRSSP
jgi:LacI family transcriptional regulator